jgi:hypothetical protein
VRGGRLELSAFIHQAEQAPACGWGGIIGDKIMRYLMMCVVLCFFAVAKAQDAGKVAVTIFDVRSIDAICDEAETLRVSATSINRTYILDYSEADQLWRFDSDEYGRCAVCVEQDCEYYNGLSITLSPNNDGYSLYVRDAYLYITYFFAPICTLSSQERCFNEISPNYLPNFCTMFFNGAIAGIGGQATVRPLNYAEPGKVSFIDFYNIADNWQNPNTLFDLLAFCNSWMKE